MVCINIVGFVLVVGLICFVGLFFVNDNKLIFCPLSLHQAMEVKFCGDAEHDEEYKKYEGNIVHFDVDTYAQLLKYGPQQR
jgi:hypothetical protein